MKDQPKISPSLKRILTLSGSNKFVACKQGKKVLKVNAAYVEQHYQSTGVEAI